MIGRYIAAVQIEDEDPITSERTTSSSGHYTLWGEPAVIASRVVSVVPSQ